MAQTEVSKVHNERQRNEGNRTRALELFKAGASFADIGRALEVSRVTARNYVKTELAEITESRRELAEQVFDGELARLDNVIRQSWTIAVAACKGCNGSGVGPEPISGATGLAEVCIRCAGDGRQHRPEIRLRALREYRQAIDQRCQMLGLYAPEKFAITNPDGTPLDFREELAHLAGDDLSRELEAYLAGAAAAQSGA